MPFVGLWVLCEGGDGGGRPDVEIECVDAVFKPICELRDCVVRELYFLLGNLPSWLGYIQATSAGTEGRACGHTLE